MLREFNEYKISLLIRGENSSGDDLDIQIPKTFAEGVYINKQRDTVLDHVRSQIVHATKKDHIILAHGNKPLGFAILEPTGYLKDEQFNPVLIGIHREYRNIVQMLVRSKLDPVHDIGTMVMVLDASKGDETVKKAHSWATYRFKGGDSSYLENWDKMAEEESIEFSFSWADLGAPFKSTKDEIDRLGQEGHTHEALEALNKLSAILDHLYFGTTKIRKREEVPSYKVTDNLMSNKLFPGDLVMYVTGERENPKLNPFGDPIHGHNQESYPHQAQIIRPDTLTLHGDMTGYYENNQEMVIAPKIKSNMVTKLDRFFANCHNLVKVPWYDTAEVKSMKEMFLNCETLADIPTFQTDKLENASRMFLGCSSLKYFPYVTTHMLIDTSEMFKDCTSLVNIPNLELHRVKDAHSMFQNCTLLTSPQRVVLPMVENVISMYENCIDLDVVTSLNIPSAKTCESMFRNCEKLTTVSDINISECTNATNMFDGCIKLRNVSCQHNSIGCNISFANTQLTNQSFEQVIGGLKDQLHDPKTLDIRNTNVDVIDNRVMNLINTAKIKGWTVLH